ncbi:Momilactone A synthase [Citrus sinensis]|nr:Momilactone A synthase [Citrus sinensis]
MLQLWHGNSMLHRLLGKVALITGGASGFGECTARLFSRHGAKVLIADIKDDLGESVCKDIGSSSSSANGCSYVHCDVTKEKEIENAVNTAVSQYGKLDIMFNNAGIVDEAKHNILDNDQAEFELVLSVNLVGVFLGTKHAARVMKPAGRGSIISTASVCGVIGGVASHAYTSSKHGVVGLMKNAAVELGRFGIRVNCVSPYVVATPLAKDFYKLDDDGLSAIYSNLSGAVLKPEDVAEAALYLGSDESKCVSGHNLVVDGGFTIVNEGLCMFGKSE